MDVLDRLAKNLRQLRHAKGWSQEELAHRAEIHRTYISDLERAARNPTITIVERLAGALGTTAAELVG